MEFFELVKARTAESGYFHVQFGACHTMLWEGKTSLLDLEAVYPIDEYVRIAHYHSVFDHAEYERYVAMLNNKGLPEKRMSELRNESSSGHGATMPTSERLLSSVAARLRSVPGRAWRRVRTRVGSYWPRIDLIQCR